MQAPSWAGGRGLISRHLRGRTLAATKEEVLLNDGPSFQESDELRDFVNEAQDRGYLTQEEMTSFLEEVDLTDTQLKDLHAQLMDRGIEEQGTHTELIALNGTYARLYNMQFDNAFA